MPHKRRNAGGHHKKEKEVSLSAVAAHTEAATSGCVRRHKNLPGLRVKQRRFAARVWGVLLPTFWAHVLQGGPGWVCTLRSLASLDAVYLEGWISDGATYLTKFPLEVCACLCACARRGTRAAAVPVSAPCARTRQTAGERKKKKKNHFYLSRNNSHYQSDC